MTAIAIIPARGGSKRIPRKNIREFLGKPVIVYAIDAAKQSGLFQEVMVSTDDQEIADIAVKAGANVPFMRSEETATDMATTASVLLEVLDAYERQGKTFNVGCCVYPTSVFTTPGDLQDGFKMINDQQFDSVFSAVRFSYPVWRGLQQTDDGRVEMIWPEHLNSRSQDLKPVFHDAGQWYWFTVEGLRREERLFMQNSGVIVLDENRVQDIDNEMDWKLATLKYRSLNS